MSFGEEKKETKLRRWLRGQTTPADGCGAAPGGGWSWSLAELVPGGPSGCAASGRPAAGPSTAVGRGEWAVRLGRGRNASSRWAAGGGGATSAGLPWSAKHSLGLAARTAGDAALPRGPEAGRQRG